MQNLAEPKGRAALVSEVWGPPSVRRRAREIARAGGTGAGLGAGGQVLDCASCTGCGDAGAVADLGQALIVIALAAVLAIFAYYLIKWVVLFVRRKWNEPCAKGALARPPSMVGPCIRGRVSGEPLLTSPVSDQRCLAVGLELAVRRWWTREVMLRDATTSGFDVSLEDGQMVRVPPGRIRLEGTASRRDRVHAANLENFLHAVDPRRIDGDQEDPIPFDEAAEVLLRPGDAIELVGKLAPVADATRGGGYREAAMALAPAGVACVRVTRGAARALAPGPAK